MVGAHPTRAPSIEATGAKARLRATMQERICAGQGDIARVVLVLYSLLSPRFCDSMRRRRCSFSRRVASRSNTRYLTERRR